MIELYKCDPAKNTECKKTGCQTFCFSTRHIEYAQDIQQMTAGEVLELVKTKLNERKMSIPIDREYTEDHRVGWRDGIFWRDVLEIFEELEGGT
jgi:hypothetical protein